MENTHPLVSIALCTFNGERYLSQQMDSLLEQSYRPLEIVVVDDGSTDNTITLLRAYMQQGIVGVSIRLFENVKRLGYVKNFEKAISLCTGYFVAISDQDDIWDYKKVEILVQNIEDNVLIYHDSLLIDEGGNSLNKKMSDRFNMFSGAYPKRFLLYNCVSGHSCMFKSDIKPLLGLFSREHYYDQWIAYVASNCGKILYLDKCLVKYRQHSSSAIALESRSSKFYSKKRRAREKIIEINKRVKKDMTWLKKCKDLKVNKHPCFTKVLYFFMMMRQYSVFSLLTFLTLLINKNTIYYSRRTLSDYNEETDIEYIKRWYLWGALGVKLRYFWRK